MQVLITANNHIDTIASAFESLGCSTEIISATERGVYFEGCPYRWKLKGSSSSSNFLLYIGICSYDEETQTYTILREESVNGGSLSIQQNIFYEKPVSGGLVFDIGRSNPERFKAFIAPKSENDKWVTLCFMYNAYYYKLVDKETINSTNVLYSNTQTSEIVQFVKCVDAYRNREMDNLYLLTTYTMTEHEYQKVFEIGDKRYLAFRLGASLAVYVVEIEIPSN